MLHAQSPSLRVIATLTSRINSITWLECDELCVCCYKHLLDDIFGYPRIRAGGMTVGELSEEYPDSILIVRIEGHLTCIIHGIIRDIWDCSDKIADIVWKVA